MALAVEHRRRFPTGVLAEEREVLDIEALLAAGFEDRARRRARRFAVSHPGSSHHSRIARLLDAQE
jgi:hypothetical protein